MKHWTTEELDRLRTSRYGQFATNAIVRGFDTKDYRLAALADCISKIADNSAWEKMYAIQQSHLKITYKNFTDYLELVESQGYFSGTASGVISTLEMLYDAGLFGQNFAYSLDDLKSMTHELCTIYCEHLSRLINEGVSYELDECEVFVYIRKDS